MNLPNFYDEEFDISPDEALAFQRLSSQCRSSRGWIIGERFNDRYDTEVGGQAMLATQWIDESGQMQGDYQRTETGELVTVQTPSAIVDYEDNGRRISVEEAEHMPEIADVLHRLREREAAYLLLLQRQEEQRRLWAQKSAIKVAELQKRRVKFLPAQVLRVAYAVAGL